MAIVAAYESMARVSFAMSVDSYHRGFHSTGTFGAFGSAGGVGRLLGLDPGQLNAAFGLAATQAAGLKASFGTMGKHLNAGRAAANGLYAAQLAERGFTAARDGVAGPQGLAWTLNTSAESFSESAIQSRLGDRRAVELLMFKPHASCGGTHSVIESIRKIRAGNSFDVEEIKDVELTVPAIFDGMCTIPDPATGLEGKFSLRYTAALALLDADTGPESFTDKAVSDTRNASIRRLVRVMPTQRLSERDASEVRITLASNMVLSEAVNPNIPVPDERIDELGEQLARKFMSASTPVIGAKSAARAAEVTMRLTDLPDVRELTDTIRS
jgi:2-methylcitrate dehydratase PrpD